MCHLTEIGPLRAAEHRSGLFLHQKPPRSRAGEGWGIYPPYPIGVPAPLHAIAVF